eukprot:TRINITY_DN7397_c0_g2_i4.p1 TRINITY_DN7397_c0_g2~~TRINITY_DN7397_c0_g2_i4.p1  ORF type:complete len:467 (+),score=83.95 TRINITY_DN7397_c0_g2_i4:62-1462(+)
MKVVIFALVSVMIAAAKPPAPEVPEVTEVHKATMQKVREIAGPAAKEARPQLLSLMDEKEFRDHLRSIDPSIADLTSIEMLNRLQGEMQVAEVTHNFEPHPVLYNNSYYYDLNVESTIGYEYLLNLWQLRLLELNTYPIDYQDLFRDAEHGVYQLPVMPKHPSYENASNALVYGALQWMKPSTETSLYGGIGFVLDNNHIRDYTAISPIDTGAWEEVCGNFKKFVPPSTWGDLNCTIHPGYPVPGTYDDWEHLILQNVKYFNISMGHNKSQPVVHASPEQNLATLIARSFNKYYPNATLTNIFSTFRYSEANPLMNLNYKKGVKALVYNFTDGFGSGIGRQFQDWAISNNWVVVWTGVFEPDLPGYLNRRIVDPYVLMHTKAGQNFTTDPRFPKLLSEFTTLWDNVNSSLPTIPSNLFRGWYLEQWESAWKSFKRTILEVQPLSAGACSSASCSVTRVIDGVCICR